MNYFFYFPLLFWFITAIRLFFNSLHVKVMYVFSLLLLVLLVGTRWFVAADFEGYYDIYEQVPFLVEFSVDSTKHIYGEIGYLFIISIFKTFGLHFSFFILVLSVLSIYLKYFFLSRFALGFFAFSIYLLVSFISVELIEVRWSISISFILLAYYYGFLYNKKLLSSLFFICSLLFHYYSILFIFIFLFLKFFKNNTIYYIIFCVSFLFAFYIYLNGFSIHATADSELYVIQRFFRYLSDPDSKVGLFSILKVLYFLSFYYFVTLLCRGVEAEDSEEKALLAFLMIYSIALLLSFVPVFYFRASAVADLFGLLMVFIAMSRLRSYASKIVLPVVFSFPFILWFMIDVSNSFVSSRIFDFSTSLKLII